MTKQDLQKELLEKVKPGTKPSQLKRSKSASDLPKNVQATEPRRKSLEVLTNPNSLKKQLAEAQDQISILELKLETSQRELEELTHENKATREQNEALLTELAKVYEQLNEMKESDAKELDNSLVARHQNLKDWFSQYQKNKSLDKELTENIKQASNELITQDQTLSQLRGENFKLKQTNQSLTRDLTLVQKLAESRKVPYFEPEFNQSLSYFKYAVYALLAVWFCLFLKGKSSNLERNYYD